MPWLALDTHYLDDPKIQAAGEVTPYALSVFPALLAEAKQRAAGGKVEVSFRNLAHLLFLSRDQVEQAVEALVSAGVLTCPQRSETAMTVVFPAWRKWNERFRKATSREAQKA